VIGRRLAEAALHDYAVAIAETAVAGGTIDIESLLTTQKVFASDLKRKRVYVLTIYLSGKASGVDAQMAAGDRSLYFRTGRATVSEKLSSGERFIARLVVHILAAGRENDRNS